jgi:hypothetical protein
MRKKTALKEDASPGSKLASVVTRRRTEVKRLR